MAKAKTPSAPKAQDKPSETQPQPPVAEKDIEHITPEQSNEFDRVMAEIKAKSEALDKAIAEVAEQQAAATQAAAVAKHSVAVKHMEPRPPAPAAEITARTVDTLVTQHPLGTFWYHGDPDMPEDAPATVPGNKVIQMRGGYRVDF
jgi:Tfp pilus assembly protein FimV